MLHARAEVLEAAGKPLALAVADFVRARDIRRRQSGPKSMDAAFAAFNLARMLTLQSREAPASSRAADDVMAPILQAGFTAESLALEAHGIALAAGEARAMGLDLVSLRPPCLDPGPVPVHRSPWPRSGPKSGPHK